MYAQVEKTKANKSRAVANSVAQKKNSGKQGFGFVDNRPEAKVNTQLRAMANNFAIQQQSVHNSSLKAGAVIQPVWKIIDGPYLKWIGLVDGLQWYSHKKTSKMYYVIVDESQLPDEQLEYYKKYEGSLLPLESWLKRNKYWQDGNWDEKDLGVFGEEVDEEEVHIDLHTESPPTKWKYLGHEHSQEGTIERLVQQLYCTGQKKNIDVHGVVQKLKKLRTLGPQWEELAADPSLMLKPKMFESFITFLNKESKESEGGPWEARKRFAKSLRFSSVYRAIWVKPEVVESIKLKGQKEQVIMPGRCAKLQKSCDCAEVLNNFELTMSEHVQGEDAAAGLYQSVSSNPKIAEAVANRTRLSGQDEARKVFGGLQEWAKKKVYLLTLAIPNIDLFYIGDINKNFINFKVDLNRIDEYYPLPYNKDAEQLVLGNIKGAQIRSIEEIEDPQGKAVTYQ